MSEVIQQPRNWTIKKSNINSKSTKRINSSHPTFMNQFQNLTNQVFTLKTLKQEQNLKRLQSSHQFGSKFYQKTSVLNFPMSFNPKGLYDNESLESELKKLQMRIDNQNEDNNKLLNQLFNINSKIHTIEEFMEKNKYLFENSKELQKQEQKNQAISDSNQSKLESEHSTIKMLKDKIKTLQKKYQINIQQFEEIQRTNKFSNINICQNDISLLWKELQKLKISNQFDKDIVHQNKDLFDINLISTRLTVILERIEKKTFKSFLQDKIQKNTASKQQFKELEKYKMYRMFIFKHLLISHYKDHNHNLYRELNFMTKTHKHAVDLDEYLKRELKNTSKLNEDRNYLIKQLQSCLNSLQNKKVRNQIQLSKESLQQHYENKIQENDFLQNKDKKLELLKQQLILEKDKQELEYLQMEKSYNEIKQMLGKAYNEKKELFKQYGYLIKQIVCGINQKFRKFLLFIILI